MPAMCGRGMRSSGMLAEDWGEEPWIVNCPCGVNYDDGEEMVECDACSVWVHTKCCKVPKGLHTYVCVLCKSKKRGFNQDDCKPADMLLKAAEYGDGLRRKSASKKQSASSSTEDATFSGRVHVHGVPGGDARTLRSSPNIFSRQLWKSSGLTPKSFRFQTSDLPSLPLDEDQIPNLLSSNNHTLTADDFCYFSPSEVSDYKKLKLNAQLQSAKLNGQTLFGILLDNRNSNGNSISQSLNSLDCLNKDTTDCKEMASKNQMQMNSRRLRRQCSQADNVSRNPVVYHGKRKRSMSGTKLQLNEQILSPQMLKTCRSDNEKNQALSNSAFNGFEDEDSKLTELDINGKNANKNESLVSKKLKTTLSMGGLDGIIFTNAFSTNNQNNYPNKFFGVKKTQSSPQENGNICNDSSNKNEILMNLDANATFIYSMKGTGRGENGQIDLKTKANDSDDPVDENEWTDSECNGYHTSAKLNSLHSYAINKTAKFFPNGVETDHSPNFNAFLQPSYVDEKEIMRKNMASSDGNFSLPDGSFNSFDIAHGFDIHSLYCKAFDKIDGCDNHGSSRTAGLCPLRLRQIKAYIQKSISTPSEKHSKHSVDAKNGVLNGVSLSTFNLHCSPEEGKRNRSQMECQDGDEIKDDLILNVNDFVNSNCKNDHNSESKDKILSLDTETSEHLPSFKELSSEYHHDANHPSVIDAVNHGNEDNDDDIKIQSSFPSSAQRIISDDLLHHRRASDKSIPLQKVKSMDNHPSSPPEHLSSSSHPASPIPCNLEGRGSSSTKTLSHPLHPHITAYTQLKTDEFTNKEERKMKEKGEGVNAHCEVNEKQTLRNSTNDPCISNDSSIVNNSNSNNNHSSQIINIDDLPSSLKSINTFLDHSEKNHLKTSGKGGNADVDTPSPVFTAVQLNVQRDSNVDVGGLDGHHAVNPMILEKDEKVFTSNLQTDSLKNGEEREEEGVNLTKNISKSEYESEKDNRHSKTVTASSLREGKKGEKKDETERTKDASHIEESITVKENNSMADMKIGNMHLEGKDVNGKGGKRGNNSVFNKPSSIPSKHLPIFHSPAIVKQKKVLNSSQQPMNDQEYALLLHQELNSSPRVPRMTRVSSMIGINKSQTKSQTSNDSKCQTLIKSKSQTSNEKKSQLLSKSLLGSDPSVMVPLKRQTSSSSQIQQVSKRRKKEKDVDENVTEIENENETSQSNVEVTSSFEALDKRKEEKSKNDHVTKDERFSPSFSSREDREREREREEHAFKVMKVENGKANAAHPKSSSAQNHSEEEKDNQNTIKFHINFNNQISNSDSERTRTAENYSDQGSEKSKNETFSSFFSASIHHKVNPNAKKETTDGKELINGKRNTFTSMISESGEESEDLGGVMVESGEDSSKGNKHSTIFLSNTRNHHHLHDPFHPIQTEDRRAEIDRKMKFSFPSSDRHLDQKSKSTVSSDGYQDKEVKSVRSTSEKFPKGRRMARKPRQQNIDCAPLFVGNGKVKEENEEYDVDECDYDENVVRHDGRYCDELKDEVYIDEDEDEEDCDGMVKERRRSKKELGMGKKTNGMFRFDMNLTRRESDEFEMYEAVEEEKKDEIKKDEFREYSNFDSRVMANATKSSFFSHPSGMGRRKNESETHRMEEEEERKQVWNQNGRRERFKKARGQKEGEFEGDEGSREEEEEKIKDRRMGFKELNVYHGSRKGMGSDRFKSGVGRRMEERHGEGKNSKQIFLDKKEKWKRKGLKEAEEKKGKERKRNHHHPSSSTSLKPARSKKVDMLKSEHVKGRKRGRLGKGKKKESKKDEDWMEEEEEEEEEKEDKGEEEEEGDSKSSSDSPNSRNEEEENEEDDDTGSNFSEEDEEMIERRGGHGYDLPAGNSSEDEEDEEEMDC